VAGEGVVGEPRTIRIGQTWEWTTPPRKVADDRLAPLASRVERFEVPADATAVEVVATSRRMSAENAAYHALEGYPVAVETHRERLELR
jgi:hypothetical protein